MNRLNLLPRELLLELVRMLGKGSKLLVSIFDRRVRSEDVEGDFVLICRHMTLRVIVELSKYFRLHLPNYAQAMLFSPHREVLVYTIHNLKIVGLQLGGSVSVELYREAIGKGALSVDFHYAVDSDNLELLKVLLRGASAETLLSIFNYSVNNRKWVPAEYIIELIESMGVSEPYVEGIRADNLSDAEKICRLLLRVCDASKIGSQSYCHNLVLYLLQNHLITPDASFGRIGFTDKAIPLAKHLIAKGADPVCWLTSGYNRVIESAFLDVLLGSVNCSTQEEIIYICLVTPWYASETQVKTLLQLLPRLDGKRLLVTFIRRFSLTAAPYARLKLFRYTETDLDFLRLQDIPLTKRMLEVIASS